MKRSSDANSARRKRVYSNDCTIPTPSLDSVLQNIALQALGSSFNDDVDGSNCGRASSNECVKVNDEVECIEHHVTDSPLAIINRRLLLLNRRQLRKKPMPPCFRRYIENVKAKTAAETAKKMKTVTASTTAEITPSPTSVSSHSVPKILNRNELNLRPNCTNSEKSEKRRSIPIVRPVRNVLWNNKGFPGILKPAINSNLSSVLRSMTPMHADSSAKFSSTLNNSKKTRLVSLISNDGEEVQTNVIDLAKEMSANKKPIPVVTLSPSLSPSLDISEENSKTNKNNSFPDNSIDVSSSDSDDSNFESNSSRYGKAQSTNYHSHLLVSSTRCGPLLKANKSCEKCLVQKTIASRPTSMNQQQIDMTCSLLTFPSSTPVVSVLKSADQRGIQLHPTPRQNSSGLQSSTNITSVNNRNNRSAQIPTVFERDRNSKVEDFTPFCKNCTAELPKILKNLCDLESRLDGMTYIVKSALQNARDDVDSNRVIMDSLKSFSKGAFSHATRERLKGVLDPNIRKTGARKRLEAQLNLIDSEIDSDFECSNIFLSVLEKEILKVAPKMFEMYELLPLSDLIQSSRSIKLNKALDHLVKSGLLRAAKLENSLFYQVKKRVAEIKKS